MNGCRDPVPGEMNDFYSATDAGRMISTMIGNAVIEMWSDIDHGRVVATGSGGALFSQLAAAFPVFTAFITSDQLCRFSNTGEGSVPFDSAVVCETWPLENEVLDAVVLMHALELSKDGGELLREAWRVLVPGGRLFVAAANRYSLWPRTGIVSAPHANCYGIHGLVAALTDAGFDIQNKLFALHIPPFSEKMIRLSVARSITGRGKFLIPDMLSGLMLIEARKLVAHAIGDEICALRNKEDGSAQVGAVWGKATVTRCDSDRKADADSTDFVRGSSE